MQFVPFKARFFLLLFFFFGSLFAVHRELQVRITLRLSDSELVELGPPVVKLVEWDICWHGQARLLREFVAFYIYLS